MKKKCDFVTMQTRSCNFSYWSLESCFNPPWTTFDSANGRKKISFGFFFFFFCLCLPLRRVLWQCVACPDSVCAFFFPLVSHSHYTRGVSFMCGVFVFSFFSLHSHFVSFSLSLVFPSSLCSCLQLSDYYSNIYTKYLTKPHRQRIIVFFFLIKGDKMDNKQQSIVVLNEKATGKISDHSSGASDDKAMTNDVNSMAFIRHFA